MYGVIYKITNSINNKIYMGQTVNSISKRSIEHCCNTSDGHTFKEIN